MTLVYDKNVRIFMRILCELGIRLLMKNILVRIQDINHGKIDKCRMYLQLKDNFVTSANLRWIPPSK